MRNAAKWGREGFSRKRRRKPLPTPFRLPSHAAVSTASSSSISCGLNRNVAAPISSSICFGFRAPTIVAVIAGWRSVHAIATSPGVRPCFSGNRAQALDQRERPAQQRLLIKAVVAAPVAFGQRRDPLARHLPGQQARLHRRVRNHADVVLQTERQDLLLDLRAQHRVRRLQVRRRLDARNALQLRDVEVRHADEGDLAFVPQFRQRRPRLFDRSGIVSLRARRPHGPVNLVQIDPFRLQPAQALLDFPANRSRIEAVRHAFRRRPTRGCIS